MQPAPDSSNQMIGAYLKTSLIDVNENDKVYHGFDPKGRNVMLRIIENASPFHARFSELMPRLLALKHPNIVETLDFGEHNGVLYQVCEYVPGGAVLGLTSRLKQSNKVLPIRTILMLIRDAALALELAHSKGLIHGDVRPNNLLLERIGESENFLGKLTDFGLNQIYARPVQDLNDLLGSPMYMAPEQFQGRPLTAQTDIYSLGMVFYELVTGKLPFQGESIRDLAAKHVFYEPPRPEEFRRELLPAIAEIILRALKKSPAERYARAADFARDVEDVLYEIEPADIKSRVTRRVESSQAVPSAAPNLPAPKETSKFARLSVFDREGKSLVQILNLDESDCTIGRSESCSLVLDAGTVSRYHLLIRGSGERVFVKQTGSTNPTYLVSGSQVSKLETEEVVWPWYSALYLHPYWMRLDPPRSRIGVNAQEELVLVPGVPTPLPISLKNLGDKVDTFVVELEGVPNEWLHSVAETRLNPDTTADLTLVFLASQTSQTRSGEHAAHLLVRSTMDATEAQRVPLRLIVQPFVSSQLSLSPSRVRTRSTVLLNAAITNTGNQVARYTLDHKPTPNFSVQIGDQKGLAASESGLNETQHGLLRNWFRMLTAPLQNSLRRLWERNVGGALRKGQWVKEQADQFVGAGDGGSQAKPSQPGHSSVAPNEMKPRVWTVEPGRTLEVPVRVSFPPVLLGRTYSTAVELEAKPFGLPKDARVEPSLAKAQLDHNPILPLWLVPAALLIGAVAFLLLNRAPTIEDFVFGDGKTIHTVNEEIVVNYKVSGARSLEIRSPVYKEPIRLDPQSSQYELPAFTRPTAQGNDVELSLVARGLIRSSEAKLTLTVQNAPTPEPRLNLNLVNLVGGQERTVREFRRNQTVYLKWWARNYEEIRLSGLEGRTLSKSPMTLSNLPPGIYNLVLSARNGDKQAQANLSFTVKGLPAEIEFSVTPKQFVLGEVQSLTATWRTQNATKVNTSFSGDVQPSGRATIPAPVTAGSTQFTLTVTGEDGVSLERKEIVNVKPPPTQPPAPAIVQQPAPPTQPTPRSQTQPAPPDLPAPTAPTPVRADAKITTFTIEPREFIAGQQKTLRVAWSTENSTGVTLSTVSGNLPASGKRTLNAPTKAGVVIYTLTARGKNGKIVRKTFNVTVLKAPTAVPPPPVPADPMITEFIIEPGRFIIGDQNYLLVKWSTENSTQVTLTGVDGNLPPSDHDFIKAPTEVGEYTYTLTARGKNGKIIKATFPVFVDDNTFGLFISRYELADKIVRDILQPNNLCQNPNKVSFSDVPEGHWAREAVELIAGCNLLTGFPDGTFRGNRKMTRYEAAIVFRRIILVFNSSFQLPSCSGGGFSDVPAGHWAREPVELIAGCGIIAGYPDKLFLGSRSFQKESANLAILNLAKFLIDPKSIPGR